MSWSARPSASIAADDVGEPDALVEPHGELRPSSERRRRTGRAARRSARGRPRRSGIAWTLGRPISAFRAAGVPSATMRPWSMIPTRSARTSASSRYCVVRKTVTPSSRRSRATSSQSAASALRVEPGRRLVEEEHARTVDEREREVEAALHPARVAADLAIGRLGQPDALEELLGAALRSRPREPLEHRLEAQVVASGQQAVERRLLERGADHAAHLRPLADDVEARDRAPCRRSAAGASSASARSSTCRRRSGRGSRRSRPARRGGRSRRPRAGPS